MVRIRADVGPVVPAALAFAMLARLDLNFYRVPAPNRRGRRDEYEPKVIDQARYRVVMHAIGDNSGFGLQRRSDLTLGADAGSARPPRP